MKFQKKLKFINFESYLQIIVLFIPVLLITGPFLPDLFLSLSVILFLYYLVLKKELGFLNHRIFHIFLIFFLILILSSLLSDYFSKSIITSLGYLRFGVFIFLISFLVNKTEYFINKTFFVIASIFFVLFCDAIFQKLTGSNILGIAAPYGRITSLFGDDIKLGGYIFRLTPLLVATMVYLKFNRFIIFCVISIAIFLTFISGERTSFLMILMFLGGYLIFDNTSLKLKLLYLLTPVLLMFLFFFDHEIRHRVFTSTLNQININNEQPYYKYINKNDGTAIVLHRDSTLLPRVYHMYFETSVKIFRDNILLGSGPRTYPFKSKEEKYFTVSSHEGWLKFVEQENKKLIDELFKNHKKKIDQISNHKKYQELKENINLINNEKYINWLKGYGLDHIDFEERIKNKKWLKGLGYLEGEYEGFTNISGVNSHPHNTYLQLLSETGILGTIFIITLWFFCIFKLFTKLKFYHKCLLLGLIINLFPFMFAGNFFNGWLSILYFYPLGFLLIIQKSNNWLG